MPIRALPPEQYLPRTQSKYQPRTQFHLSSPPTCLEPSPSQATAQSKTDWGVARFIWRMLTPAGSCGGGGGPFLGERWCGAPPRRDPTTTPTPRLDTATTAKPPSTRIRLPGCGTPPWRAPARRRQRGCAAPSVAPPTPLDPWNPIWYTRTPSSSKPHLKSLLPLPDFHSANPAGRSIQMKSGA